MIGSKLNPAETEYAIMLAALNFQTEFMKSRHTAARVRLHDQLIEIILTGIASVPAETCLAETPEGRALLQQSYTELFRAGEPILRRRLERDLGIAITHIVGHLDPMNGTTTIFVQLLGSSTQPEGAHSVTLVPAT